mmetsp:Transcript_16203/g.26525  ORF Transcript_16203/g.26525 Transcript_16203/m.26525 type:complete len:156 (+) Transcript_16203:35-502(+)
MQCHIFLAERGRGKEADFGTEAYIRQKFFDACGIQKLGSLRGPIEGKRCYPGGRSQLERTFGLVINWWICSSSEEAETSEDLSGHGHHHLPLLVSTKARKAASWDFCKAPSADFSAEEQVQSFFFRVASFDTILAKSWLKKLRGLLWDSEPQSEH